MGTKLDYRSWNMYRIYFSFVLLLFYIYIYIFILIYIEMLCREGENVFFVSINRCIYIYMCVCVCVCVCMYMYMCICICISEATVHKTCAIEFCVYRFTKYSLIIVVMILQIISRVLIRYSSLSKGLFQFLITRLIIILGSLEVGRLVV